MIPGQTMCLSTHPKPISKSAVVPNTMYSIFLTSYKNFTNGIMIDSSKIMIEAIRLPIENHNGKSGCRRRKHNRYPGLSLSKFWISSFVNLRPVATMTVFFSFFVFILLASFFRFCNISCWYVSIICWLISLVKIFLKLTSILILTNISY